MATKKLGKNDLAKPGIKWSAAIERFFGCSLWEKQKEIVDAVEHHRRVAVRSCHGSGKTFSVAALALLWLVLHRQSLVVTTAPTFRQVSAVMWPEIHMHVHRATKVLAEYGLVLGATLLETELKVSKERRALGLSTNKPDQFQGLHSPNLLVIVDEAAGVDTAIYEAIEGLLTGANPKLLLIGNPTSASGNFYDAFHRNAGMYKAIHISAFDTPNLKAGEIVVPGLIDPHYVEDKKLQWGEESPMYRSRVLGEFSDLGDDTLIALSWVEAAYRREGNPGQIVVSLDVARFGSDLSALATLTGDVFGPIEVWGKRDTKYSTARLERKYGDMGGLERGVAAVVDDAGLGAGVTDHTRIPILRFLGAEQARKPDIYNNKRTESWFEFAKALKAGEITLPEDSELAADLTSVKYTFEKGKYKLEPKEQTKKRLGRSPDRGDAVVMAWYYKGSSGAPQSLMEIGLPTRSAVGPRGTW